LRSVRLEGGAPVLETRSTRILFDSAHGEGLRCLSHAHMDHAGTPGSINIMTRETHQLFASRRIFYRRFMVSPIGSVISPVEGVSITALNSGHMLGSSMFKLEGEGLSIIYTGDMNVYDSVLQPGADSQEAEILIIESTYGSPVYRFPSREEIYHDIVKWVIRTLRAGEVPAFKAYPAGKAQEIIALINKTFSAPVIVTPEVFNVSRVYKNTYRWLEFVQVNSRLGQEAAKTGAVYVSSRRDVEQLHNRRVRWALATGWVVARRPEGYDAYFPLSAHSDFDGLTSYVKNSDYRKVISVYGYSTVLAKHLRRLGFEAYSLEDKLQVML